MRWWLSGLLALGLTLSGVPRAQAQLPPGGYYADGAYYAPAEAAPPVPAQEETAYWRGVYAYAPGFGPYLRLGGESGWNPNRGSTYNAYPFGDYATDYGLPPLLPYYIGPAAVIVVPLGSYGAGPRYWPWR
ncbi:MAG TPA: hypothetical protein VKZ60_11050 [Chloroflexota bacterium]|nr:hypothetical protein [Chloroflexota bacterium]